MPHGCNMPQPCHCTTTMKLYGRPWARTASKRDEFTGYPSRLLSEFARAGTFMWSEREATGLDPPYGHSCFLARRQSTIDRSTLRPEATSLADKHMHEIVAISSGWNNQPSHETNRLQEMRERERERENKPSRTRHEKLREYSQNYICLCLALYIRNG